jgi:hypothetical protein
MPENGRWDLIRCLKVKVLIFLFYSNIVWKRCGEFGEYVVWRKRFENTADVITKVLGSEKSLANLVFNLLAGA